jgi:hypothetical protein
MELKYLVCPGCGYQPHPHPMRMAAQLARRHKLACAHLQAAVLAEVQRLATELHHTPSAEEWQAQANKALPSLTWILSAYGRWNDIVTRAGLPPNHIMQPHWAEAEMPRTRIVYYWQREP